MPADVPERITRIEFSETLPGRIQWRMWTGDKLHHSELLQPEDLGAALETARFLLQDLQHHEKEVRTETRPCSEVDPDPRRLD